MAIAQGLKKSTVIGLQTGLGVPQVTTGQVLRRKTSVFQAARAMFENDEMVSHHQSTGSSYGLKSVSGTLDGLLSPSTYQLPFQGIMEAVAVATSAYAAGIDVTAAATSPHFVDASGGYLTAGLKVGDVGRWTGFAGGGTANNARNFLITALTATNMTGVFLDGTAVAAEAAGASVTFTVVGKKIKTPLTGHTDSYYTVEEWYSDVAKSELFTDCKVSQIAVGLPASGNATLKFDMVGLGRTIAGAKAITTHTASTTTGVMSAINGFVYVNGVLGTNLTGAQITIANSAANVGAVIGSNDSPDVAKGRIKVSGSITGLFDSSTLTAFLDAETNISVVLVTMVDNTATSDFMTFTMGRVKLTSDTPDDGEKGISRTYNFTSELNSAGGASLAWDQNILTVQDSAAA